MIRILIADDHAIVREGLKQIVSAENDMIVAGEADSAEQLFVKLNLETWDIVVLDISMPGTSGLDALKSIRKLYPRLPVLVLSMHSEDQYGLRAIKNGASGYLKKVSAPDELVKAIRKIVEGGKYISSYLSDKLMNEYERGSNRPPHETLSDREYEIMCMIAEGLTAENIADSLSLSIHTVYSYRNRILEKMNLRSNVELTQYVIQNRLNE